ncbi:SRPBCC family protein [Legionella cardiaca]|uniref:SRPBCC family protein n=1 Tax=Legionella cardiaca TaxID=1071983 RepID=A0ABY8APG5_9GAMM|nr:SRPBCC family protein [Legionella cardiaca]WED42418.1 SRPBCC family protein [Legionella cardiaca]
MNNTIEKSIELKAPLNKVWDALTDYRKFGQWFRVNVETPFIEGKIAHGSITYPGYEHIIWQVVIQKLEPQHYFSFTWHPFAVDMERDYSNETPTLVEFRLQEISKGTLLTVTESGFEKLPKDRFMEAFRMNNEGWDEQLKNISNYVSN